jgi:hypothetical protein
VDTIFFQAVRRHGELDGGCSFEVSTDGGATFTPAQRGKDGRPFARVPSLAALPGLTVRAHPADARFWPGEGTFRWLDGASHEGGDPRTPGPTGLVRDEAPPEQFFVQGTEASGADSVTVVYFHLNVFRDVSQPLLDKLRATPSDEKGGDLAVWEPWPPTAWVAPPPASYHAITPDVVSSGDVVFETCSTAAGLSVTLLERKGAALPQLFVVGWPDLLPCVPGAGPTPFLVFFTHELNQNLVQFKHLDRYPDSWDYLHLAVYHYLNYGRDPIDLESAGQTWRGLVYQMSLAGKTPVLFLPVGDAKVPAGEVGDCLDAAKLEDLLIEVQAFFFKRAGLFQPPSAEVGRTAMASFSSGNNEVSIFLTRPGNLSHRFYLDTLRELYCLDVPRAFAPGWARAAETWAGRGKDSAEKVIRMYGTDPPTYAPIHQALVGGPAPAAPYASSSGSGTRTVAVLPEASWRAALNLPNADPQSLAGYVHELCAATLLADALRRSTGF